MQASLKIKVVATIRAPGHSAAQLHSALDSLMFADLDGEVRTQLATAFVALRVDAALGVHRVGPNVYEVYPKFVCSGDSTLSREGVRQKGAEISQAFRAKMESHLLAQGVSILGWHIH